jgi:hypothetical protein
MDDEFFGAPLVLAHWIQNKSSDHPISDKIFKIIFKEHQKQSNNFHARSKLKQLVNTFNYI